MTPLISIIIPTYNSEKYLKECLDSIVEQTYENLEVIIVDGGSTDATQNIVKTYCNNHHNWTLIVTSKGVSHQRNVGLEVFKGDFLFFLDSDDYVSNNFIDNMFKELIDRDLDLVTPAITNIFINYKTNTFIKQVPLEPKIINILTKHNVFEESYDSFIASPYKLFKRNMVDNNRYDESISNGEDLLYNYQVVLSNGSIKYGICGNAIYYYRHDINIKNPAIKRMNKGGYGFCNKMLTIIKGMLKKDKNYYGALEILDIQLSLFLKQYASNFKIIPFSLLGPRFYVFKNSKKKRGRLFYLFPRLYLINKKIHSFLSKVKRKLKQVL